MPNNFTVKLYNTDKNMITNILSGHENSIKTIELFININILFVYCFDDSLTIWNLVDNSKLFCISNMPSTTKYSYNLNRYFSFVNSKNQLITVDVLHNALVKLSRRAVFLMVFRKKSKV